MNIVGLRVEKYIGTEISGSNMNFEYQDSECERHVILGILEDKTKVEITLSEYEDQCSSGWTTASYGEIDIEIVDKFGSRTHDPIKDIVIDDIAKSGITLLSNEVFSVDYDGGDEYYPSGGYNVNMSLFKPNARHKELRPTYVFAGDRGIGKSTLASKFNDVVVFETDAYDELPDKILADVIVLGNKHGYDIDDIKTRVENTALVLCLFGVIDMLEAVKCPLYGKEFTREKFSNRTHCSGKCFKNDVNYGRSK